MHISNLIPALHNNSWNGERHGRSYIQRLSERYGPEIQSRLDSFTREELEPTLRPEGDGGEEASGNGRRERGRTRGGVAETSAIVGANVSDEVIETYYSGKPDDAEAIQQFRDAANRVGASLGEDGAGVERGPARLWAYGDGPGATNGYGEIQGKLYPPREGRARAQSDSGLSELRSRY